MDLMNSANNIIISRP